MRIISVRDELLKAYTADKEFLLKTRRPCVLVVRLKYKEQNHDFAIPLRSNISSTAPRDQYFALPPRSTTRGRNHHGLHYIKMFPVSKPFFSKYRIDGDSSSLLIQSIIDKHEKEIIADGQAYLTQYENGIHVPFSTNIDLLLHILAQTELAFSSHTNSFM